MHSKEEKILFPLSSRYDKEWIRKNSLGENVLYNLETLCEVLGLKPEMKVLDLGCGKAVSAIFLAKEFGVNVLAVDPKINPDDNMKRINEMGCENLILPLRLDARRLPFPHNYFDVILAVDSFMYYGTDLVFNNYITNFLKQDGQIGIVDICFGTEVTSITSPDELPKTSNKDNLNFVHSLNWWYRLWETTGHLQEIKAEIVPHNNFIREEYIKDYQYSGKKDIIAEELKKDDEKFINVFRMYAKKNENIIYTNNSFMTAF